MKAPKLAIIIPCYNEEEVIQKTSKRFLEVLENVVKKNELDKNNISNSSFLVPRP